MDNKLNQILRLYGELGFDEDAQEDDELRAEAESLRKVKQALDARPRVAVPESAVRNVLEMARMDRQPAARPDRRPVARGARRNRPLFVAAGSTLVLLLMSTLVLWNPPADELARPETTPLPKIDMPEREAAGAIVDAQPPAPAQAQQQTRRQPAAESPTPAPERLTPQQPVQRTAGSARNPQILAVTHEPVEPGLAWDEDEDIRRLHLMIDVVQARGEEIDWDEPAVPLELLPARRTGNMRGYQQAGHQMPRR